MITTTHRHGTEVHDQRDLRQPLDRRGTPPARAAAVRCAPRDRHHALLARERHLQPAAHGAVLAIRADEHPERMKLDVVTHTSRIARVVASAAAAAAAAVVVIVAVVATCKAANTRTQPAQVRCHIRNAEELLYC